MLDLEFCSRYCLKMVCFGLEVVSKFCVSQWNFLYVSHVVTRTFNISWRSEEWVTWAQIKGIWGSDRSSYPQRNLKAWDYFLASPEPNDDLTHPSRTTFTSEKLRLKSDNERGRYFTAAKEIHKQLTSISRKKFERI